MVDLVDKGEAELQQLTQKVTMTTSSASMKASLWVGKGVAAAPFKAVTAIYRSIQKNVNKQRESGQVSLKDFSKIAEGKRDLVNIDDRAVSKELERELRRHGVVWSVETHRDGSRTFHVQGKDAELIQHALTVAAERVDEKLARNAPELQQGAEQPEQQTAAPATALPAPAMAPTQPGVFLQLGAFASVDNAESLRAHLLRELDWLNEAIQINAGGGMHRVHMGPYRSRADAERVAERIHLALGYKPTFITR